MSSFGCSFPGCDRHPSKGDTILRISAKGKGMPFVGRCAEHYGSEEGRELARSAESAAAEEIGQGRAIGQDGYQRVEAVTPRGEES